MAANATNPLSALSTTARPSDTRNTRESGSTAEIDFGAQYKNEIRNQMSKPADKVANNPKPADKSASANRDNVKEKSAEIKPNSNEKTAETTPSKPVETVANQEAASDDSANEAQSSDANVAAMLAMMQLVNQVAPAVATVKTDPALVAEVGPKAIGTATDGAALKGLLLPGAATQKEAGDMADLGSQAQTGGNSSQQKQAGLLTAAQLGVATDDDATAKIAADPAAILPLDSKNSLASNAFSDALAQKMNPLGQGVSVQASNATTGPQATAASASVASHYLETPVQDARWSDAVAQRVSLMLGKQEQQIEMQLNPPNLGPMEVRMNLGGEQASIVFTSQHAAVREALAAATPKLTALLADQGIVLSNVQVASDSLQQQQQQAQQQQQGSAYTPNTAATRYASATGLGNIAGVERTINLNDLRIPVGSTRVSLFV